MAGSDSKLADTAEKIFIGKGEEQAWLTLALANRHGLVTGATGTGKTVTLQLMAEGFARAGVPALMPWHGVDWDEGGVPVGRAAWDARFEADYHQPSDEWSADLDFRSAVENLDLLYRLGFDLANSTDWPGWKPSSEFGAVRARTDAARR